MKYVDIDLTPNEGHAMRALANAVGPNEDPIEFLASMIDRVELEHIENVDLKSLKSLKDKLEFAREEMNKPAKLH